MVSLSDSVNGDLWGWQISTPHKTPEQIDKKIGTIDYIREWASLYTKFCRNPFTGGFWANGWNVTKIICIYLYLFFFDQPTGQTRGWIFTRNSSKDVKSRLMYTVVCTPNKMASNLSILFKMVCISPTSIRGDDKLSELSATKLGDALSSLRSSICTRISITSSISRTVRSVLWLSG